MLTDIETSDPDEFLVKMADALDKHGAYPWPPPPWWKLYERRSGGSIRDPVKTDPWYREHIESFKSARTASVDGIVRVTLRFRTV
jgi:hypothetical protein